MQPAGELPLALGGLPPMPPPLALGPAPFLQTSFGEVLSARMAGAVPKGSPFSSALQLDGEPPSLLAFASRFHFASGFAGLQPCTRAREAGAVRSSTGGYDQREKGSHVPGACTRWASPAGPAALCSAPASSHPPGTAGLLTAQATPVKSHPAAAGTARHPATPLEAHTPVSAQAARSSAGRRPLSADTGCHEPAADEGGAGAGGQGDTNPLAFLAIAASMDE